MAVARALQVGGKDAKRLLKRGLVLPADLTLDDANALRKTLAHWGVMSEVVDVPRTNARCEAHPTLTPDVICPHCQRAVCVLCESGCQVCEATLARQRKWKRRRVIVLVLVLLVVAAGAWLRVQGLSRRNLWIRPLQVSLALVSEGEVRASVEDAWRTNLSVLEAWFAREAQHYGLNLPNPVEFKLVPGVKRSTLPSTPESTGSFIVDAVNARAFSERLAELAAREGDIRLVIFLGDGGGASRVEGVGEQGGIYGLVAASAQDTQINLELMALVHELLHCLGAADAYDTEGHAEFPQGFVEPDRSPRYPQEFAEVMVGEVPTAVGAGRLPSSLSEVRIGPATAKSIGW